MLHHYVLFFFGFLQLCTGATITRNITFTDTNQFQDISLYNFAAGLENTYEFLVTARAGKQVSLYLFQNDQDMQYKIDAYDGTDDKSPTLQVGLFMVTTKYPATVPINVTSTEENMFVRVTVARNSNNHPDFQAMVTDYNQAVDCEFPAYSINIKANYSNTYLLTQNTAGTCLYVIHANDPSNQASLLQKLIPNIHSLGLDRTIVYKGLQMDNDHLLQTSNQMSSLWAYDRYLILQLKQTMGFYFGWENAVYRDDSNTINLQLPVVNGYENTLMTMDYLREPNPTYVASLTSIITLNVIAPSTSVQVSYLKLGATGSLSVLQLVNGKPIGQPMTYYGNQFTPLTVNYECDQVQLVYINPDITAKNSGFYGIYRDRSISQTITTQLPTMNSTQSSLNGTNTTTVRPVQTATQAVHSLAASFAFITLLIFF